MILSMIDIYIFLEINRENFYNDEKLNDIIWENMKPFKDHHISPEVLRKILLALEYALSLKELEAQMDGIEDQNVVFTIPKIPVTQITAIETTKEVKREPSRWNQLRGMWGRRR